MDLSIEMLQTQVLKITFLIQLKFIGGGGGGGGGGGEMTNFGSQSGF